MAKNSTTGQSNSQKLGERREQMPSVEKESQAQQIKDAASGGDRDLKQNEMHSLDDVEGADNIVGRDMRRSRNDAKEMPENET